MRRPPITAILTAGACALGVAAPAAAQDGAGQRYLAWPTKSAPPRAPAPDAAPDAAVGAAAPVVYAANPTAAAPRRRAPIIPHGGFGRMPDTAPAQNLTPASAWLGPHAPVYAPVPPPAAYAAPTATPWTRDLTPPAPTRALPQPVYAPPVAAPTYAAPPPVQPTPQPPVAYAQPAPAPAAAPAAPAPPPEPMPAPVAEASAAAPAAPAPDAPAFDPMAPRRDAPIFRLQRAAPSEPSPAPATAPARVPTPAPPQNQAQAQPPQPLQAAPQEGARYYSLHRQAGRQPDATPLPPAVYLDGLPVELTTPPASTDLAAPPAQPALIRNSNGRLQAAPDTEVTDQP